MTGTPMAQTQAKKLYQGSLESDKQIAALKKDKNVQDALAIHSKFFQDNGVEKYMTHSFEGDHRINQQTRTIVLDEFRKLDEVRSGIKAKRQKDLGERYTNVFHPTMTAIGTKIKNGDLEGAANSFTVLAKATQIPYELTDYDPNTGTMMKTYPASETGQHEPTERVSVVQLHDALSKWGKQQYVGFLDMTADATVESNTINRLNPIPVTGPKGKTYWLTSQKKVTDPSQINYSIRQDGTLEKQEFDSWEALQKIHPFIRKENLERQTAMGNIAKTKQQTQTSKAAMDSHNRANKDSVFKSRKQQFDVYNKQMKAVLIRFGGGELNQTEDGEIDIASLFNKSGKNSFVKSQELLQKYKDGKFKPSNDKEQEDLRAAMQADEMYKYMARGFKNKKAEVEQEGAPVKGARKAKDGFWYVKHERGWKRVTVSDEDALNRKKAGYETARNSEPVPATGTQKIRPELPQDMSQWNVQVIPQNGKRVAAVITEKGAIALTKEEYEMYRRHASQQKTSMGAGIEWFKENATGTQTLPSKNLQW
jgi:hypothetical protein